MTTDDLKRLAEKYPEHIEDAFGNGAYHISNFDCAFDPSGGLGSFMFRGTAHFLGHPVSEAIFSALLDEIAESKGLLICRDPNGWWLDDPTKDHAIQYHPTKLDALLAL